MANNYTQFSEAITLKSEEEREWVENHLEIFWTQVDESEQIVKHPEQKEYERLLELYGLESDDLNLNFQWEIDSKNELWMYADESGNADHVALFMQEYLKKFNPEGSFSITYSATCSKPRLGEFGGGALFVTAEKFEWIDSHDWVIEKWRELDAIKEKRKEDRG